MKKQIVFSIIGLLFMHHVICTVLYNAPVNPVTATYQGYVTNYMEPVFSQKWLLFAPEPATNDLKLWYKIRHDGAWTSWIDPLEPVLKKHQQLRFTSNAKLLYVYGNIPKELSVRNEVVHALQPCPENDAKCLQMQNDSIMLSNEFREAVRYVKEDISHTEALDRHKIDSLQIMIIQLYPKQFSERLSNKPFGFVNSTEFPKISYHDENNL